MILNARFQRPVISFGLSLTMLSCDIGDDVTVYVNDVYNENEFVLIQNEIQEATIFTRYFYSIINPFDFTEQTIDLDFIGFRNEKPMYKMNFNDKTFFIFFNVSDNLVSVSRPEGNAFFNTWVLTTEAESEPTNEVISYQFTTGFTPSNDINWEIVGYDSDEDIMFPISITFNTNSQSFTFPATESKDIQIQMRKKTGELLLSNKIQLTVNTSE